MNKQGCEKFPNWYSLKEMSKHPQFSGSLSGLPRTQKRKPSTYFTDY